MQRKGRMMFLSNVRLEVADVVTCLRFYRDVFGFTLTWGGENDAGYCSFTVSEQTSLAIHQYENNLGAIVAHVGMRPLGSAGRGRDTALLVFEVESPQRLDAYAEELRRRGAVIIAGPDDHTGWGIRSFYLRDPDGNLIEVNCLLAQ